MSTTPDRPATPAEATAVAPSAGAAPAGTTPTVDSVAAPALAPNALHVPAHSVWPAVVAFGFAFALFGVVTSALFTAAGAITLAAGVAGWILDLRREGHGD